MKIACFSTKSYDKEYLSKAIVDTLELSDVIKLLRDKKIVNIILNAKNYEMFIEEIKKI